MSADVSFITGRPTGTQAPWRPAPVQMVKVRTKRASFRVNGRTLEVGEVVSVPIDIAEGLVAFGRAEWV